MELTPKQEEAIDGAVRTLRSGRGVFRIGGYAGTGKTTIISHILQRVSDIAVGAFCGKACHVLKKKGVDANTLHSILYRYDRKTRRFYRKDDVPARGFVIDEGSMVPTPIWDDVQLLRKPVIVVGDPGQLDPVGDDARLLASCDVVLDTLHRYAGPIARYAETVRRTGELPIVCNEGVSVRPKSSFREDYANGVRYGTYLCGFNATRIGMNKFLRGHQEPLQEGDKVVILKNNYNYNVFNGMVGKVVRVNRRRDFTVTVDLDIDGTEILDVEMSTEFFNSNAPLPMSTSVVFADFGYCLTTHKFQGSEDERVCYIDEQCNKWTPARHRYTGVTRASEHIGVYYDG